MRLTIETGVTGTRVILHLGDAEAREAAEGVPAEARRWRDEFHERVQASGMLDDIRRLQTTLAESRSELADLKHAEQELRAERRRLLQSGSGTQNIERKLSTAAGNVATVSNRVVELESMLASAMAQAAAELRDRLLDYQNEMHAGKEQQRLELETSILESAAEPIKRLVRLHKTSGSRGLDLGAFHRRLTSGQGEAVVRELLATANVAEVATS